MTATRIVSTASTPITKYNYALGYLRAFIVVLVVAHHAALAYHPFAPPPPASLSAQPRWWQAFPVVDPRKWGGATLFVGFNDAFFMSLMFFLSGLFVWQGLAKRKSAGFVRERSRRLGLPFILAAAFLAPLAYYPTYLQMPAHTGIARFWQQWLSLGEWPAGPAWFVWVLLAFDCIAALLFWITPNWGPALGRISDAASSRPVAFFAALLALSAIAYIPMALAFTSVSWAVFGPFTFQTSRILHYLLYFLAGVAVGSFGVDRGLLARDGRLARRWPLWVLACLAFFALAGVVTVIVVTSHPQSKAWTAAADAGFVVSCAASCFAFLALFLRFGQSRVRMLDSLSANSYAIYLLHYAFVSWLQYALLPASLPGFAKAAFVFLGAVALSWGTAMTIRRIPAVARVV